MSTTWPDIAFEQFPLSLFSGSAPPSQLLAENLLFFAYGVLVCMAGIWLGLGTWRRWYWRVAVITLIAAPLLAAYDPSLSLPFPLLLIPAIWLGGVTAIGFRRNSPSVSAADSPLHARSDRFRLLDLFAFVALSAVSMAVLRQSDAGDAAVLIAAFSTPPTIGALWAIHRDRFRWLRLPIAIASVWALTWIAAYALGGNPSDRMQDYPSLAAWNCVYLVAWLWSIRDFELLLIPARMVQRPKSCLRTLRMSIGAILTLAVTLPVLWLEYRLVFPYEVDRPAVPQPDVRQSLAEVASGLKDLNFDPNTATLDQLRSYANAMPAETARISELVRLPSSVPKHGTDHRNLTSLRQIYYWLDACAQVAKSDGDVESELNCYLDMIWLGRVASQGGAIIDCLVGFSFEETGVTGIRDMYEMLSPEQLELALRELARFETGRESWSVVWQRDQAEWHRFGWQGGYVAAKFQFEVSLFGDHWRLNNTYNTKVAKCRLLMAGLAIELYRHNTGRLPTTLEALAPQYLNAIPIDPFAGAPLVYRTSGDRYLLYSFGPNHADDGGTPQSLAQSPDAWDILLRDAATLNPGTAAPVRGGHNLP